MKNVLPIFEFYVSSMYHLLRGVTDYAKTHRLANMAVDIRKILDANKQ